jgi:hypothetical protein
MAIITDYTTLSSAVASYLDRSDLTAMIPNFIEAAEQQVYRRVRHRGVETEFTANTSSGLLALSGLTNFREMKWMRVSSTPGVFLEPMTVENLYRQFPDRTATTATPRAYARDGGNLIFGPAAASSISLDGVYYALLPNLSASNTTNWFTTNAPEVLLYGALMHGQRYLMADPSEWAAHFREAFDAVQLEGKYENRTGSRRSVKVL